ncbi:MAG: uncharacterized protein JWO33_1183 [Caulobacteraceae bacterium]|nr:uncharacterized protein [Caulobacteraceae bacterium]
MGELKTHSGGCHCGAVRFEVETDLAQVIACNCSHCSKKGFLLTFTPADRFRLASGDEVLTDYRFNTHKIAHRFCSVCGVQPFGEGVSQSGEATRAVNVRCLDDVDLDALTITQVDGRRF